MHNEDGRGNGVPAIDLESGGFPHLTPHLLSSMKLPEDAHEHALLNSNEGTAVCSGSGQVSSKVVPEDVGSGDNDSSSAACPTTIDREPHDHSGLSCVPNDTSVSKNETATKDDTLGVPTIVVSEGGTHIFDFSNMSSQSSIALSPKKAHLSRNSSSHEQCRVCQQEKDEDLITLGCQCRGELARAHRSCIDTWFRTKGSNKCEICQQVAVNVPPPESYPSASYWVWRVDPAFRGGNTAQGHQRGCYSPLWVAFSILIGGLLLDVLISITLGVSALPVNIIIGVIVVLGLGTALRLALEVFQDWNVRRVAHRMEPNVTFGYNGAV